MPDYTCWSYGGESNDWQCTVNMFVHELSARRIRGLPNGALNIKFALERDFDRVNRYVLVVLPPSLSLWGTDNSISPSTFRPFNLTFAFFDKTCTEDMQSFWQNI